MTSAGIPRSFLQDRCQAMSIANPCQAGEQQAYFDDLAVSSGSEAQAMVLNVQFRAKGIQLSRPCSTFSFLVHTTAACSIWIR
jgi:hypothetical protein